MPKKHADETSGIAERLTLALDNCEPRLTRSKLAELLGVSPAAVSHYLNGKRPCPEEVVGRIAKITKAEPGWILRGVNGAPRGQRAPIVAPPTRPVDLVWGFREAPQDGGKDFGNAGVYATPATIETLVREDGQNSLDASRGTELVLRFRIVELSPMSKRYERVLDTLRFGRLKEHIRAIDEAEFESKLGAKLVAGLDYIDEERLTLLVVDDYGTHGLQGGDFDSTKSFSALVRDNLNSRKDSTLAGGIFGVGAKVNLACSRLSTVLFASKVQGEEARGTRLVGRTEMTYHSLGRGAQARSYAGPGWFGEIGRSGVVESVWLPDDDPVLDDLMLRRDAFPPNVDPDEATGTSIMIVGFTDPQTEAGANAQQLADHFIEAAAVNFWPAMVQGRLSVWVECYTDDAEVPVKSERVDPTSIAGVNELCQTWEQHFAGNAKPVLDTPGDVASIEIPMSVPATRPRAKGVKPHEVLEAEAVLLVRLADPDAVAGDPRAGHVAYVRGRSMVTRYQRRTNAVGGRPFHAIVLAGDLVGRSNAQIAAEQFLRISEPPAHDRWVYHADVGEKYKRGGKKALDEFHARVTEELQRVLKPLVSGSREGPEVLKRLLQLNGPTGSPSQQPGARILRNASRVVDGAWHVEAEISINPTARTLLVTPRLSFRCEGASPIPVAWAALTVEEDGNTELDDQTLVLKPRTKRVSFTGISNPRSHPVEAGASSAVLGLLVRFGSET